MTPLPEQMALQQTHALCQTHGEALLEALHDMRLRALTLEDYQHLSKEDRRLLDQFAYRYTRLQDDMGARLMPAVLKALGEEVGPMSAIDRFSRLEQLGWLASADDWLALRQVRNQFSHDYPENASDRYERLQAATHAAYQLLAALKHFQRRIANLST